MKISNPFVGVMPETGMKSRGSKFWFIVPMVLALWVGGQIATGFILGTLVVVGLMLTVEQFPGFWAVAQNTWGRLVISVGTGWLAHKIVTGDAIAVAVAMGWATMLKMLILTFEAKRLRLEKAHRAGLALERINRFRATQPIQGEWYRSPH